MDKALIFGSNGLLGQSLLKRFSGAYHVYGASLEQENHLTQPEFPYYKVDLTSRSETRELIGSIKPALIINAAAYTNVDGCEDDRETCWNANVHAVEHILDGASLLKATLVQISTDYVFDGDLGNYRETDLPNPRGNYSRSKLAAENIIRAGSVEYLIARTQVLFGAGQRVRPNFATWVVEQLKKGNSINVVTDQIGCPTYAPDLAEGIFRLLQNKAYGIFHISGPDSLSRYDFAVKIARTFGLDETLIKPITTEALKQKAPRPMNSTFILDKLVNYSGWQPQALDAALRHFKEELEQTNG